MKKYFRLMLAGALALVMILSLVSCGSSLEMSDVEDALEEYAEDNEDEYYFSSDVEEITGFDKKNAIKALEAGAAEVAELKEGVASVAVFMDADEFSCIIVEFENKSDAKKVGKALEDGIEDAITAAYIEYFKLYAKEMGMEDDFDKAAVKERAEGIMDEIIEEFFDDDFAVETQGNIVFFGAKDVVDTALEAIEDAK